MLNFLLEELAQLFEYFHEEENYDKPINGNKTKSYYPKLSMRKPAQAEIDRNF